MNKAPLSTQTGKLFIVIRKNKEISIDKIKAYCEKFGKEYAFIVHKNDKDKDTGEIIPIHYHIVLNAIDKNKRLSTHLNDIAKFFDFDNLNGVEIDKYRSLESALQYLLHKNDKDKTQHKFEEIVSNFNKDELLNYITCDVSTLTFDFVYSLCKSSNNIIEVIRGLGLGNFQRYRATIWDIWNELKK